jgi:hypothetical protein
MPTKTRKKATPPATQAGQIQTIEDGAPTTETIRQAVEELGLNRPFYTCRLVGNRLEFSLYGGDLVYWPPKPARM